MIFENPGALLLLLALPPSLLGLGLWGWKAKKDIAVMFSLDIRRLRRKQVEEYTVAGLLMSLLIVALALPKIAFTASTTPQKTGEIALLVDVSASMAAQKDVDSPNRIQRAKPILYEIIDSMDQLGEVRISLHGFLDIARSLVPSVGKEDYPYLKGSIRKVLDINCVPGEGTSLGQAIENVAGKFSPDQEVRIVVLLSDGEAFIGWTRGIGETERGWIEEALKKATEEGVKVVTVGVGEPDGAKIPLYDEYGEFTGDYAKLRGADYISYLEEDGLKEIASRTGGRYFFEKNREGLIEFIEENLGSASTEEVTAEVKGYRYIAHWFVLAALPVWVVFARNYLLE